MTLSLFADLSLQVAPALWSRIERELWFVPASGCWLHEAGLRHDGYSHVYAGGGRLAPKVLVHRISFAYWRGPLFADVDVMHRCDVRCCCNPVHLFAGSQVDNMADMVSKGRARNGGRRLDEAAICDVVAWRESHRLAALRYGVTKSGIAEVRYRHGMRRGVLVDSLL